MQVGTDEGTAEQEMEQKLQGFSKPSLSGPSEQTLKKSSQKTLAGGDRRDTSGKKKAGKA